jgi:hypothetical protein
MAADKIFPFDEDLLGDVDWLGEVLDIGDKFMVSGFLLCLAVGVRENCPREGAHIRSGRGPRTGIKEQETALMQAALFSVDPDSNLEPGSVDFVSRICEYANGGLIRIRSELEDSEDPRARLIMFVGSLVAQ